MSVVGLARKPLRDNEETFRLVHVVQGDFAITSEPDIVLTTILGSCVSACIRDPLANVGGMNHFLLPGEKGDGVESLSYGVHAMELMINSLLQHGALRGRLEAKLFGGARVVRGLSDAGARNAEFATEFLRKERVACLGMSLGGDRARRIRYWPVTGRASQSFLAPSDRQVFETELQPTPKPTGSVEMF